MIDSLKKCMQTAIADKVFPGCAAGIYLENGSHIITAGNQTYDKNSPEINGNTIYDVASITKVVPVSLLALKLIHDGQISTDDKLIKFVPEFQGAFREKIRIKHLLTHTLFFDFRLSDCKDMPGVQIEKKILNARFQAEPGERFFYANATSILLGMVIERCMNMTLDVAAKMVFFEPLEMKRTAFDPSVFSLHEIAPSEIDPWRGREIRGEVHDESAWAMRPKIVGSAGLFSTAPDLLKVIQMILNSGISNGREFFRPDIIAMMHTNQLDNIGEKAGLGWELSQDSFMGRNHSASAIGKTGFTGCSIVIDPLKKVGFVLLSNHTYPERYRNRDRINSIRRMFADLVLGKQ